MALRGPHPGPPPHRPAASASLWVHTDGRIRAHHLWAVCETLCTRGLPALLGNDPIKRTRESHGVPLFAHRFPLNDPFGRGRSPRARNRLCDAEIAIVGSRGHPDVSWIHKEAARRTIVPGFDLQLVGLGRQASRVESDQPAPTRHAAIKCRERAIGETTSQQPRRSCEGGTKGRGRPSVRLILEDADLTRGKASVKAPHPTTFRAIRPINLQHDQSMPCRPSNAVASVLADPGTSLRAEGRSDSTQ